MGAGRPGPGKPPCAIPKNGADRNIQGYGHTLNVLRLSECVPALLFPCIFPKLNISEAIVK